MKKIAASLLILGTLSHAHAVDLLSFGSTSFSIDPGSNANYSQTTSAIVYNTTVAGGDTVYNDTTIPFTNTDWSGFASFAVDMSLLGGSTVSVPFTITLYDTSFTSINIYDGDTSSLLTIGQTVQVPLTLNTAGSGILTDVQYVQIVWGSGGTVNTDFKTVVGVVPEPSTYALLALSGLALGGYAVRRRHRA